MVIALTPQTQKLIEERMRNSGFGSPDELVQAALRWLDEQDPLHKASDAELESLFTGFRQKVADGLAAADSGKLSDGESFFDRLENEGMQEPAHQPDRKTA